MSDTAASAMPRTIGVLICSYRRPDSLLRGLAALTAQERRPDDVVVVARLDDVATLDAIAARPSDGLTVRVRTVSQPGTVHALNTGLDCCRTDVLAITDDDTAPHPDWLARIMAHFSADPALGALGGRDWVHDGKQFDDRGEAVVGRLQWFGRNIGQHHLGIGPPRDVDFLKGANMSYRARALAGLRFDTRLRGTGAQPMEDMSFSFSVRRAGWKVRYDPLVAVDHYPAPREEPRHYVGGTTLKDAKGLTDAVHNEVVALWEGMPATQRLLYVAWSALIGTRNFPGVAHAIRAMGRQGTGDAWRRFQAVQLGRVAGYRTMSRDRRSRDMPALGSPNPEAGRAS